MVEMSAANRGETEATPSLAREELVVGDEYHCVEAVGLVAIEGSDPVG